VGVPVLTQWATENEEAEFMYSMLKKRECPGYLYMIDNGAYTTWEYWNGIKSQIHNCYNGIGSWFYQALAGICPDEKQPGYRHTYIKPQPVSGIDWVKAAKNTPYGKLAVEWKKEDGKFIITINIPVGSTATICLPDGTHSPTLPSGHHTLSCSI
jgi:alpha-L-rhamnosidase